MPSVAASLALSGAGASSAAGARPVNLIALGFPLPEEKGGG